MRHDIPVLPYGRVNVRNAENCIEAKGKGASEIGQNV